MARGKDNLYRRNGIFCFRYKDANGAWKEKSAGERDRTQARDEKRSSRRTSKTANCRTKQS